MLILEKSNKSGSDTRHNINFCVALKLKKKQNPNEKYLQFVNTSEKYFDYVLTFVDVAVILGRPSYFSSFNISSFFPCVNFSALLCFVLSLAK